MPRNNNNKGYVFVGVLIVVVLLAVLGGAYVIAVNFEVRHSYYHGDKVQAYYYARSGAEAGIAWLKSKGHLDETNTEDINSQVFESPEMKIVITHIKQPQDKIELESTGIVLSGDITFNEEVGVIFERGDSLPSLPFFEQSLFAAVGDGLDDDEVAIELSGSAKIIGDFGTNTSSENSIKFGWSSSVDGNIYVGPEAGEDVFDVDGWERTIYDIMTEGHDFYSNPEIYVPPEINFPEFPALDESPENPLTISGGPANDSIISTGGYFDEISISSNRKLTIDLEGLDLLEIRVKDLDISQGNIEIINASEDSKVIFYVEDTFQLGGSSTINDGGNLDNVMIYYAGEDEPDLGGNTRYCGSIFLESADLTVGGSNGIVGHIISGGENISITGNADLNTRVIYAPNAHVVVGGSGKARGSIVANQFTASGSGLIEFIPEQGSGIETFPFEVFVDEFAAVGGGGGYDRIWF